MPEVKIGQSQDAPKWEPVGDVVRIDYGSWSLNLRLQKSLQNGKIFMFAYGPRRSRLMAPGEAATFDAFVVAMNYFKKLLTEISAK